MHQKKAAKSQVVSRDDDPDWREWVMTFEEKLMINGEEKKAEGKAEEQEIIIHTMMQEGLDDHTITRYVTNVTEDQVAEMRQRFTASKEHHILS